MATKLTKEEQAKKALELLSKFDFKLLKKQREHLMMLAGTKALPTRSKNVLDGLDNGLYELAAFAVDVLGQKEFDVLLIEPKHKSQAESDRWHKANNKRWDKSTNALVKDIKKKISKL